MEYLFLFSKKDDIEKYISFSDRTQKRMDEYIAYLKKTYSVIDLPRAIIWTNTHIATQCISNIPVPAYTNDFRIVISPDMEEWREIYLRQMEPYADTCRSDRRIGLVLDYYNRSLSENNILQILGHELAHHSELFLDDFSSEYDNGIWFEEGMVEYISRKYFLTEEEFQNELCINKILVDLYENCQPGNSLEEFGSATYKCDYRKIFYEYWRSFLAVNKIVVAFQGDVLAVFRSYHEWHNANTAAPLSEWFDALT